MTNDTFLAVNKEYFGVKLKSIDILIVAHIDEFQRNGRQCYITNRQFADILGESESSIKRSIDKLEELNVINRHTAFIKGNGRANKQRILFVNDRNKWKTRR